MRIKPTIDDTITAIFTDTTRSIDFFMREINTIIKRNTLVAAEGALQRLQEIDSDLKSAIDTLRERLN